MHLHKILVSLVCRSCILFLQKDIQPRISHPVQSIYISVLLTGSRYLISPDTELLVHISFIGLVYICSLVFVPKTDIVKRLVWLIGKICIVFKRPLRYIKYIFIFVKNPIEVSPVFEICPYLIFIRIRSNPKMHPEVLLLSKEITVSAFVLKPEPVILERHKPVLYVSDHRHIAIIEERRKLTKQLVIYKTRRLAV